MGVWCRKKCGKMCWRRRMLLGRREGVRMAAAAAAAAAAVKLWSQEANQMFKRCSGH